MHLPVTYSLSLGFFMMLWLRLKPEIWLLHLDASAIEKIRIVFIDEPLTGFGLIYNLLFAMAFSANCNFTIVYCFRVGFPKMKWAEAPPPKKSCLTWRLDFVHLQIINKLISHYVTI